MTDDKAPRRDYRGIITAEMLRAWTGTDADLARALDVSRQAVCYARLVHRLPAYVDGRRGPRPGLSRSVQRGIEREAHRRAGPFADDAQRLDAMRAVLADLGVWIDGGAE
jgi:hypothetical protein